MRAWAFVLVCGCYDPRVALNVPCSPDRTCPGGQMCDLSQTPPTCVLVIGDGGTVDDVRVDGAIDPDAPPIGCSISSDCTGATAPYCEPATHMCRGCELDLECPSHLCSESTGACVDAAAALYVGPGGSDAGACTTEGLPCATISGALGKLSSTRRSIRVADGTYTESVVLSSAGTILISGTTPSYANTNLTFSATGFGTGAHDHLIEATNTTLVVEGIALKGAPNENVRSTNGNLTLFAVQVTTSRGGIDCNSSTLLMRRSAVTGNGSGIGIATGAGSTVTVERSVISNNPGVGLQLGNASYTIRNSYITLNAGGGVTIGTPGATHVFEFNTVADNSGATLPTGMRCTAAAPITDSLISGNGTAPQIGASCNAKYSLFSDTAPAGTGNQVGSPAFGGTYHITATSAARNIADPSATTSVDFDGEPRPQGGRRDVGADEIP